MRIERDLYLNRLISKMHNGKVKVITGIRRCGKSYLLRHIFKDYLLANGVKADHILEIALDQKEFEKYRNPNALYDYVIRHIDGEGDYFLFVDEIQLSYKVKREDADLSIIAEEDRELAYTTFYDILNDLMAKPNLDIYVTGSNSRMLSKDIATNFRDRGSVIRMFPLSFSEFCAISALEKADAWAEYVFYGGMPLAVLEPDENEKANYLAGLFDRVYIADVVERYGVEDAYLENLIDVIASSVGSLTNPSKLANTLNSVNHAHTSDKTVKKYLDALEDAFIFEKAQRYDIKGKAYFESPLKYYCTDVGLRNARLGFRQIEETHLMENILFNELVIRGYSVDVGAIRFAETKEGKKVEKMHEIDFVVNMGMKKVYIQSAFSIADEEKKKQEIIPLLRSGDFFKKIVVTAGNSKPHMDENGICYTGIIPFLLNPDSIDAI
ncbi:MAG: ATP-binding protein [Oscillospiraceae bacterium]|nr:ATP-binding protein [Oscillospiraceae bacterium]